MNDFYDALLYFFPNLLVQHEIWHGFLPVLFEIEKQVLDIWSIGIFVGFDSHDVDALRLEGSQYLRALLLCEIFIVSVYVFDVVCHDGDVFDCKGSEKERKRH